MIKQGPGGGLHAPHYEAPNPSIRFQQVYNRRPTRLDRQIDGIPGIDALRLIIGLVFAVRSSVGGIFRWCQWHIALRELQASEITV